MGKAEDFVASLGKQKPTSKAEDFVASLPAAPQSIIKPSNVATAPSTNKPWYQDPLGTTAALGGGIVNYLDTFGSGLASLMVGHPVKNYGDATNNYTGLAKDLSQATQDVQPYVQQHPNFAKAGEFIGGMIPWVAGEGGLAAAGIKPLFQGAGIVNGIARNAAAGGFGMGALSAIEKQGTPQERIQAGLTGAAGGALFGGGLGAASEILPKAIGAVPGGISKLQELFKPKEVSPADQELAQAYNDIKTTQQEKSKISQTLQNGGLSPEEVNSHLDTYNSLHEKLGKLQDFVYDPLPDIKATQLEQDKISQALLKGDLSPKDEAAYQQRLVALQQELRRLHDIASKPRSARFESPKLNPMNDLQKAAEAKGFVAEPTPTTIDEHQVSLNFHQDNLTKDKQALDDLLAKGDISPEDHATKSTDIATESDRIKTAQDNLAQSNFSSIDQVHQDIKTAQDAQDDIYKKWWNGELTKEEAQTHIQQLDDHINHLQDTAYNPSGENLHPILKDIIAPSSETPVNLGGYHPEVINFAKQHLELTPEWKQMTPEQRVNATQTFLDNIGIQPC